MQQASPQHNASPTRKMNLSIDVSPKSEKSQNSPHISPVRASLLSATANSFKPSDLPTNKLTVLKQQRRQRLKEYQELSIEQKAKMQISKALLSNQNTQDNIDVRERTKQEHQKHMDYYARVTHMHKDTHDKERERFLKLKNVKQQFLQTKREEVTQVKQLIENDKQMRLSLRSQMLKTQQQRYRDFRDEEKQTREDLAKRRAQFQLQVNMERKKSRERNKRMKYMQNEDDIKYKRDTVNTLKSAKPTMREVQALVKTTNHNKTQQFVEKDIAIEQTSLHALEEEIERLKSVELATFKNAERAKKELDKLASSPKKSAMI